MATFMQTFQARISSLCLWACRAEVKPQPISLPSWTQGKSMTAQCAGAQAVAGGEDR